MLARSTKSDRKCIRKIYEHDLDRNISMSYKNPEERQEKTYSAVMETCKRRCQLVFLIYYS